MINGRSMDKLLYGAVVVFSILQTSEQGGIFGAPRALYGPEDHVIVLNATNLKSTIYGTSNGWIVEFFSSWCGHCINFAPVYKQFAAEVEGWQDVVKVAGIDCADEANIPVCRDYEIMGYPTILFFAPGSKETKSTEDGKSELNRGEQFPRSEKVSQLKHDLMDIVTPHFPNVLGQISATVNSFSGVWKSVRSSIPAGVTVPSLVVLLYESEKSFVGKELALRLSSYPEIRVLRFQKRNFLYEKLGLKDEWPAAGYLKTDLKSGVLAIPKNKDIVVFLQSSILKLVNVVRTSKPVVAAAAAQIEVAEAEGEVKEVPKEENNLEEPASTSFEDVVSLEDLIHAVRNSLRNEVGILKTVSGAKLKVLKNYVHILGQLFPADRREMIVFLMKLDKWLGDQPDEIQVNDFLDKLTELELELHPWDIDISSWGTCKGTVPGRRGYTCSLWRLFHTLTMLASQKTQEIQVLPVVHGFVKEFFGCSECVKHFTKMVKDDGALQISTARAQAIWLWKAHNKVNTRLKGSLSEDPGFPKGLYPSQEQCSGCYTSEGSFDEEKVFEYLNKVYTNPVRTMQSVESEKSKNSHPAVVKESALRSRRDHQQLTSRFFSGTDYWIFCLVYLSVAALLIFGYIHFKIGSRRRIDPFAICRKLIHSSRSIV